ncbi:MAG: hypothetical protein AB7D47_04325 [Desulfovibrio sp.]|jgi:hypothetical protein
MSDEKSKSRSAGSGSDTGLGQPLENVLERVQELEHSLHAEQQARSELEKRLREARPVDGGGGHVARAEQTAFAEIRKQKRVPIVLPASEGAGGRDAVFVAVNGLEYSIPREQRVEVPRAVYRALQDATVLEWESDDAGRPQTARRVPRFNVQMME